MDNKHKIDYTEKFLSEVLNPKLSSFLEKNKDISIIGFWWALCWRPMVIIYIISFFISLVIDKL